MIYLTLFFCSLTFAQTAITGVVSDAKKQPIPGANVKIAGASNSASTDVDGKFTLNAVNLPCKLEITSVGYAPQTVSVSSAEYFAPELHVGFRSGDGHGAFVQQFGAESCA